MRAARSRLDNEKERPRFGAVAEQLEARAREKRASAQQGNWVKHKVAVIGSGTMGRVHAEGYSNIEETELVGVVDIDERAGKELASSHATRWFASTEELFASTSPDLVDVCLPTYLHADYVRELAQRRVHVICEKPLARTLEDAAEMVEACHHNDVRLFVAHVVRFFPAYETLHRLVETNEIGETATAYAMRGGVAPTGWQGWYADFDRSGSLILDLMIHDFDFFRWCFGEVERVYAKRLGDRGMAGIDHAFASLRFVNGTIASVEGSWAYPSGFRTALELSGRGGTVTHDSEAESPISSNLRSSATITAGVAIPESPVATSPYQTELEHFVECLDTGDEPRVTVEDAVRAMEISLAALESASSGKAVTLRSGPSPR